MISNLPDRLTLLRACALVVLGWVILAVCMLPAYLLGYRKGLAEAPMTGAVYQRGQRDGWSRGWNEHARVMAESSRETGLVRSAGGR